MANRFHRAGAERARGVRDLFAAVAPRYDLINDLQSLGLHRRWKKLMVRQAAPRPGQHALDLCCGTGDIAFALAAAGARVTGVDFSEPMLAVARRRATRLERAHGPRPRLPEFLQGDALALPFPDATFDIVTIAYGLRNLADIHAGLSEMARVTRPGGRLVVLDFGRPPNRLWRTLYFLHLRTIVPLLGRIFCGDPETHGYILESLRHYPDAPEIQARMEQAGWSRVRWRRLLGGVMTLHHATRTEAS